MNIPRLPYFLLMLVVLPCISSEFATPGCVSGQEVVASTTTVAINDEPYDDESDYDYYFMTFDQPIKDAKLIEDRELRLIALKEAVESSRVNLFHALDAAEIFGVSEPYACALFGTPECLDMLRTYISLCSHTARSKLLQISFKFSKNYPLVGSIVWHELSEVMLRSRLPLDNTVMRSMARKVLFDSSIFKPKTLKGHGSIHTNNPHKSQKHVIDFLKRAHTYGMCDDIVDLVRNKPNSQRFCAALTDWGFAIKQTSPKRDYGGFLQAVTTNQDGGFLEAVTTNQERVCDEDCVSEEDIISSRSIDSALYKRGKKKKLFVRYMNAKKSETTGASILKTIYASACISQNGLMRCAVISDKKKPYKVQVVYVGESNNSDDPANTSFDYQSALARYLADD